MSLELQTWLSQCQEADPARQIEALQHLRELDAPAPAALPVLIDAVRSPDVVVRSIAAGVLGRLGVIDVDAAGTALLGLLADPEVIVRSEAVDALGVIGHERAVDPVRALLERDPEPLVRAAAAETLGDLNDVSVVPALVKALRDTDEVVRGYAANALGLLGGAETLPHLQRRLDVEASGRVQAEIHGARYRLGATQDGEALLHLLRAADEDLAINILNIIADLTSRRQPPSLLADAGGVRSTLADTSDRLPLLRSHTTEILAQLSVLETPT